MILSTILYLLMQVVFITYVSFIWIKFGIQKSISESYYVLPEKINFLFILFCWLFAFPAMILGNSWLMLAAGGGIVFVGAAAAMHLMPTRAIHLTGAIGGIIASQLSIYFDFNLLWLNVVSLIMAAIVGLTFKKYALFCIELVAFLAISIALGIKLQIF